MELERNGAELPQDHGFFMWGPKGAILYRGPTKGENYSYEEEFILLLLVGVYKVPCLIFVHV